MSVNMSIDNIPGSTLGEREAAVIDTVDIVRPGRAVAVVGVCAVVGGDG